jgi:threonine dehydrogenase-like Zn-dependent dehydrogenase
VNALVRHGTRSLAYEEVPDPVAGADEVVLDVALAGICGSDLHGYRGHPGPRVPPLVLGHEVVGKVDGRRYAVYALVGCGACARCDAGEDNLCGDWRLIGMHRPGVFAERVAVPRRSLVPLPPTLELRRAVLAEPLACCVGAVAGGGVDAGSRVVVLGCGPIGLLTVYLAARAGAEVVAVDPLEARRAIAGRLGATSFEPEPGRADVVVDAAGFESTWRSAIDAVRSGGTVVVVGLGAAEGVVPMATVVRRALVLRGQFAYTRDDFARALEILVDGDLDLDWLSDAPLSAGESAFAGLVDEPERAAKVLLTP